MGLTTAEGSEAALESEGEEEDDPDPDPLLPSPRRSPAVAAIERPSPSRPSASVRPKRSPPEAPSIALSKGRTILERGRKRKPESESSPSRESRPPSVEGPSAILMLPAWGR